MAAPSDYREFPVGGYTTYARNVLPFLGRAVCAAGVDPDAEGARRDGIETGDHTVEYVSAGIVDPHSVVPVRVQVASKMLRLRSRVLAWEPDVVYSNSPETTVALSRIVSGGGIPVVHHIHGTSTDTSHSPHIVLRNRAGTAALTWLLEEAVRRSTLVLGVSADSAQIAHRSGRPFELVPACVDTALFRPADPVAVRPEAPLRIASVGRLDPVKNLSVLVRAVRVLADSGVEVSLVIAGDGPERPRLESLAAELGLSDSVEFLGTVDAEGAAEVFRAGDVAVLTSLWEGLPISMLEAMSSGLVVVAPRLPGIAATIEDGRNGILFDGHDPADVAEAILRGRAAGGPLGRRARRTVQRDCSAQVVGARVAELLDSVARHRTEGER